MRRSQIEELKERVRCGAVLENAGFVVDVKESTRRAIKFRRGGEIIIVTHEGKGWFDPLSDDKGDVFTLVERLDGTGFVEAFERVGALVGFQVTGPVWRDLPTPKSADATLAARWGARRQPWRGSLTWCYLCNRRCLPPAIVRATLSHDLLREGPHGSMWAAHHDNQGLVCGWEERGPEWRGFATGGIKTLFRFGSPDALRFCVTEAGIDAMSLAAIEGVRDGTVYLSTGGGWSPHTESALRALAARPGALLVAATDANAQGDTFAERLWALAEAEGCGWQRLRPPAEDWNDALTKRKRE